MAVEPPPLLVEVLRRMERPARPGIKWTPEEQWHMTLRFFASVPPEALVTAMEQTVWPGPVAALAGPRPTSLGAGRVWVLPVSGLESLAAAVARATAGLQLPTQDERRPFRGHLTLARVHRPVPEPASHSHRSAPEPASHSHRSAPEPTHPPSRLRELPAPEVSVQWKVTHLVAFRSELLPAGAVHHKLGDWPLQSA